MRSVGVCMALGLALIAVCLAITGSQACPMLFEDVARMRLRGILNRFPQLADEIRNGQLGPNSNGNNNNRFNNPFGNQQGNQQGQGFNNQPNPFNNQQQQQQPFNNQPNPLNNQQQQQQPLNNQQQQQPLNNQQSPQNPLNNQAQGQQQVQPQPLV